MKYQFKIRNVVITLLVGLILYFFFLPPMNITSLSFWAFVITELTLFLILGTTSSIVDLINGRKKDYYNLKKLVFIIIIIPVIIMLTNFALSPIFNSNKYYQRIQVIEDTEENNFTSEIGKVDFNSLPLLDKDSSSKLGDRVMGQMPELVSQFYVSSLYTQINYQNEIIRVTPLEYNGFFKYLANNKEGVKGYITVNSTTGEAKLVKLEDGMKYLPSAYLMKDLDRHLRFKYPTKIFGKKTFEIDNEGRPYWIVPTIKYHGVELLEDIEGIIIVDAISGKTEYYKVNDIPAWVDHVYDANLIISMVDDWGRYKSGFLNSIFGEKNVVMTTDGYNYIVMDDDVYLYTGITSVSSDESNLGFILTNLRTKKTRFYSVPGAEEYSAMASAEGQVQQMRYKSTFPLLINLNNRPTYLVSLKDNAGLVKMYGFIDVVDYQKVLVSDASKGIQEAAKSYNEKIKFDKTNESLIEKEIKVKNIAIANIDGNTYYYITSNNDEKYYVSIKVDKEKLPYLTIGDNLKIKIDEEKEITEIISIEW